MYACISEFSSSAGPTLLASDLRPSDSRAGWKTSPSSWKQQVLVKQADAGIASNVTGKRTLVNVRHRPCCVKSLDLDCLRTEASRLLLTRKGRPSVSCVDQLSRCKLARDCIQKGTVSFCKICSDVAWPAYTLQGVQLDRSALRKLKFKKLERLGCSI